MEIGFDVGMMTMLGNPARKTPPIAVLVKTLCVCHQELYIDSAFLSGMRKAEITKGWESSAAFVWIGEKIGAEGCFFVLLSPIIGMIGRAIPPLPSSTARSGRELIRCFASD